MDQVEVNAVAGAAIALVDDFDDVLRHVNEGGGQVAGGRPRL